MRTPSNQKIILDTDPVLPHPMRTPASRQLPAVAASPVRTPVMERILQRYAEYMGRFLGITARQLRRTGRDGRQRMRNACFQAAYVADDLTARTRRQMNVVKQDYPLEALGILAGVSIIGGFALRIWRSHQS